MSSKDVQTTEPSTPKPKLDTMAILAKAAQRAGEVG